MAEAALETAEQRYKKLEQGRDPFLTRARDCAKPTVPFVMPPSGTTGISTLTTPYQSLGARAVRTLSSKLLLALLPTTPFFRYAMDDLALGELKQATAQDTKRGDIEKALSARERAVNAQLDSIKFRPIAYTAFQHLIIAGNILIYVPEKEGSAQLYRLDQYVVRRAPDGQVLEIVIKETVNPQSLPDEAKAKLNTPEQAQTAAGTAAPPVEEVVELYTHITRDFSNDSWAVYQEVKGQKIEGTDGTYKDGKCPYIPLRFVAQPNEHYGRSYVEEYLGDLDSLEGLTQAIVEGSAAAARTVWFVNPNGVTRLRTVAQAKNNDVVPGRRDDVTTLQAERGPDLNVAMQQAQTIAQGLSMAFLMNMSVQRSGERVTAEEIRYLASELDAALGGVYTLLSAEFQLPLVGLLETRLEKTMKVPPLPKDLVQPVIITGVQAIGRGQDQQSLKAFLSDVIQVVGPEEVLKYLKPLELIKRTAAAYGLDTDGLMATEEEAQQAQQMQQQAQMMQQLGPNAVNQLGGIAKQGMANQAAQEAAAAQPQG